MTDYLKAAKQLVERLNIQNGDSNYHPLWAYRKHSEEAVNSAVPENWREMVTYRNRKRPSLVSDRSVKALRKASEDFVPGHPIARRPSRPASTTLYQLIKSNQRRQPTETDNAHAWIASAETLPKNPGKEFEKNVHFATNRKQSKEGDVKLKLTEDYEGKEVKLDHLLLKSNEQTQHSERVCPKSCFLPKTSSASLEKTSSPNCYERSSEDKLARKNSSSNLNSPSYNQKSPNDSDPVFSDYETFANCRKNNGTFRARLSVSKSVPLSPTPASPATISEQKDDLQYKLDILRAELLAMRKADQELAKKLLYLYSEIQTLKAKSSCKKYEELLDEAYYEAEMADEFPDLCDAPRKFTNKLLTSHGVTSFNIHSRRFSCS